MMNNLTLDNSESAVASLIQTQKKYIKKIKVHKWVADHYELWKKSISMVEVSLLILRKIQKI